MVASAVVAGLGALLLAVLMGLGLAVGYALGMGEWYRVDEHLGGQLAYLPGVVLIAAVALAVVGLRPRMYLLSWGVVAFVFLQVMLSDTLRLPDWVDAISPFWHLAGVPMESFGLVPAAAELLLAAVFLGVGMWGFRRRDVETG